MEHGFHAAGLQLRIASKYFLVRYIRRRRCQRAHERQNQLGPLALPQPEGFVLNVLKLHIKNDTRLVPSPQPARVLLLANIQPRSRHTTVSPLRLLAFLSPRCITHITLANREIGRTRTMIRTGLMAGRRLATHLNGCGLARRMKIQPFKGSHRRQRERIPVE